MRTLEHTLQLPSPKAAQSGPPVVQEQEQIVLIILQLTMGLQRIMTIPDQLESVPTRTLASRCPAALTNHECPLSNHG